MVDKLHDSTKAPESKADHGTGEDGMVSTDITTARGRYMQYTAPEKSLLVMIPLLDVLQRAGQVLILHGGCHLIDFSGLE